MQKLRIVQFIIGLILTIALLIFMTKIYGEKSQSCEVYSSLISPEPYLPTLELDFSQTKDELEYFIRSQVSPSDVKSSVKFGLKLNDKCYNASIHAPHINQFTCYGMPAMQHKSPQLQVNLNHEGQVVMEGKDLISIDSIPRYINWYFPHDRPYGEKIVHLKCVNQPLVKDIKSVIENISEGYLLHYEKQAKSLFQKSICELDSAETETVRKKYPFELRLWAGDLKASPTFSSPDKNKLLNI